jgi:PRTRC genetic system protein E
MNGGFMFRELAELAKSTTLLLMISAAGDNELKVTVQPKAHEGTNPALCQILSLTATAEELDEKFASILNDYKATRKSLEETLEETKAYMVAAGKAAQDTAATAAKKSTAKPADAPASKAEPSATEPHSNDEEHSDEDFDVFA